MQFADGKLGSDKRFEGTKQLVIKCNMCGKAHDYKFKDELSKREFQISGICQKCQDEGFGLDDISN